MNGNEEEWSEYGRAGRMPISFCVRWRESRERERERAARRDQEEWQSYRGACRGVVEKRYATAYLQVP